MTKVKPPQLAPQDLYLYLHENGAITVVPANHRSRFVTMAEAVDAALGAHDAGGVVFLGYDDAGLGRNAYQAVAGLGVEIVPYDTDPPYLWENGTSALISAASLGRDAILDDLIGRGADVDARDDYGATALHHAAGAGNVHAIEALVEAGADLEAVTSKGFTPATLALAFDQPEAAARLRELGAGTTPPPESDLRFHPNHHRVRLIWLLPPVFAALAVPFVWWRSPLVSAVLGAAAVGYLIVMPRSLWIGGAPRSLRGDILRLKRLFGPEFEIDLRQVSLAGFGGLERRRGRGPRWLLLAHPSGRVADRREISRLSVRADECDAIRNQPNGIVLVDLDERRRHEVLLAVGDRLAAGRVLVLPSLQRQVAVARAEAGRAGGSSSDG